MPDGLNTDGQLLRAITRVSTREENQGTAIQRQSIWCASLSCLFPSLNKKNETNQRNQTDQIDQIPAMRREMIECKADLILGEGTSSQRPRGIDGL